MKNGNRLKRNLRCLRRSRALMLLSCNTISVIHLLFVFHSKYTFFFACLNEEGINRAQRPRIRCCALEKSSMKATTLTLLAPICFLTPLQRTKAQEEQHGPAFKSVLLGRATSVWFSSELKLSHARPQRIQSHLLHGNNDCGCSCCFSGWERVLFVDVFVYVCENE